MTSPPDHIPLADYRRLSEPEMRSRAEEFYEMVRSRRTVRHFKPDPIPMEVVENAILAAGTAPNGANRQPWHFAVVTSPEIKSKIRTAAEAEEREFYGGRAPQEWLDALAPLGTDDEKPFLETAPVLIAIFAESFEETDDGRRKNYYVTESVGIATGILVTALHAGGLATLTHTPSPMGFLSEVLGRPKNERPFLLLVVGFPADDAVVPPITKKPLKRIATFL